MGTQHGQHSEDERERERERLRSSVYLKLVCCSVLVHIVKYTLSRYTWLNTFSIVMGGYVLGLCPLASVVRIRLWSCIAVYGTS